MKSNLEQLKQQIAELNAKMNEMSESEEEETFTFTKDELTIFVNMMHDNFVEMAHESMDEAIDNIEFDGDGVELEIYGREIEVTIDEEYISNIIREQLDLDLEIDPDELEETIARVYRKVKK